MKCVAHDLEVMGSNPGWVEHGGCITSVLNQIQSNTYKGSNSY